MHVKTLTRASIVGVYAFSEFNDLFKERSKEGIQGLRRFWTGNESKWNQVLGVHPDLWREIVVDKNDGPSRVALTFALCWPGSK